MTAVSRKGMRRAVYWEGAASRAWRDGVRTTEREGKHSYVLSRSYVRFVLTKNLPRSDRSRMREWSSEVVMRIGDDE